MKSVLLFLVQTLILHHALGAFYSRYPSSWKYDEIPGQDASGWDTTEDRYQRDFFVKTPLQLPSRYQRDLFVQTPLLIPDHVVKAVQPGTNPIQITRSVNAESVDHDTQSTQNTHNEVMGSADHTTANTQNTRYEDHTRLSEQTTDRTQNTRSEDTRSADYTIHAPSSRLSRLCHRLACCCCSCCCQSAAEEAHNVADNAVLAEEGRPHAEIDNQPAQIAVADYRLLLTPPSDRADDTDSSSPSSMPSTAGGHRQLVRDFFGGNDILTRDLISGSDDYASSTSSSEIHRLLHAPPSPLSQLCRWFCSCCRGQSDSDEDNYTVVGSNGHD